MTAITLKNEGSLKALRCNGRLVAYDGRIGMIDNVSAGRWEGIASGELFEIVGGRDAGGASNEWYVKWAPGFGENYVHFKSAMACLKAIENC